MIASNYNKILGVSNLISLFQSCLLANQHIVDGVVSPCACGSGGQYFFLLEVTIRGNAHRFIGVYAPTTERSGRLFLASRFVFDDVLADIFSG